MSYQTIIFDLDDTLTDDKANIKEAFKVILKYKKEEYTEEKFERFYQIDKKLWKDRAAGKVVTPYEDDNMKKAEWLRAKRFLTYFNDSISYDEAVKINELYMNGMKEKVVAREGALDIIQYLYHKGYNLVIATNGPVVPLKTKLEKIKIDKYISTVFSAEEVGFMKPHEEFYNGLLKKANIQDRKNILFIGDELEKDIKGGIDNYIDTCWINYKREKTDRYIPKYEIYNLEDLKAIV